MITSKKITMNRYCAIFKIFAFLLSQQESLNVSTYQNGSSKTRGTSEFSDTFHAHSIIKVEDVEDGIEDLSIEDLSSHQLRKHVVRFAFR